MILVRIRMQNKTENYKASELPIFNFQHITLKQFYDITMRKVRIRKPLWLCTVAAWAVNDGESIIVPQLTFVIQACKDEDVFPTEMKKKQIKLHF